MKNGCRGIAIASYIDVWGWQFLKNMDYMSWNELSMQFIKRRMLQLPKMNEDPVRPAHFVRKPVWIHPQMEGGGGVYA